ncbi:ABC transporter ATP-binding protein [Bacillus massiliglaciei]|uniref:ABC transporter ATP-binding protein n=1 Tax=Bacillus massiliglaciei TaxID=1816693 RepID=UPI000A5CF52D|nr:ABC transporter ATP-binding protein [Bacillus massiliglaciei]
MKKIFYFLKPYWLLAALAFFLMLLELGVELVQPLLMAKIIDEGIVKLDQSVVMFWGSVMIGLSLLSFAGGIVNSFAASHVAQNFGYDIRKSLFAKVQAFSFANLNQFSASSLITRMTNDITTLQNTVFMALRIMMRAPLLVILGTVMALTVDVKLALILLISIPLLVFFLIAMMKLAIRLFRSVQQKLDHVNGVMRENLMGMRLIKAFLRREHEISRFDGANDELRKKTAASLRLIETTMPVLMLMMNLSILVILWLGSRYISAGELQVGSVVAIVNYATRITASLSVFSWLIMVISRAKASSDRVNEIFDTEIDLTESAETTGIVQTKQGPGKIQFNNVFLRYPGSDSDVLKGISFTVQAGETIAIMGATGSGKSSLFQLIPRLYDIQSGEILMNGRRLTELPLESLRKQIGFVPQEALLFSGTIRENISWGKEDAAEEEIVKAAKDAQIHDTVRRLPKQYDTPLGQKGVNLSGGQKQRLSIARALVRNPGILLLDDSTSALDLKTEAKLLAAIKRYPCTTLLITQKISTAMEADRILLLEEGSLTAEGSHAELLQTNKLYREIMESQVGKEGLELAASETSNW